MSKDGVFDINTGKRINLATGRPYRRQDPKEIAENLELAKRMGEQFENNRKRSLAVGPKVTA